MKELFLPGKSTFGSTLDNPSMVTLWKVGLQLTWGIFTWGEEGISEQEM